MAKIFENDKVTVYLTSCLHLAEKITVTVTEEINPKHTTENIKPVFVKLKRLTSDDIDKINKDLSSSQHAENPHPVGRLNRNGVHKLKNKTENIVSRAFGIETMKRKLENGQESDIHESISKEEKLIDVLADSKTSNIEEIKSSYGKHTEHLHPVVRLTRSGARKLDDKDKITVTVTEQIHSKHTTEKIKPVFVKLKRLTSDDIDKINKDLSSSQRAENPHPVGRLNRNGVHKLKNKTENGQESDIHESISKEEKLNDVLADSKSSNIEEIKSSYGKHTKHRHSVVRPTQSGARKLDDKDENIDSQEFGMKTTKRKLNNCDKRDIRESVSKKRKIDDEKNGHISSTTMDIDKFNQSTTVPANNKLSETQAISKIEFKVGETVWARIKGFPHWPAKIQSFPSSKMAQVVWYNDYRRTKLYRTQLFKFLPNFDQFAKRFSDTVGLETAAREALICYGQQLNANMLF